MSFLQKLKKRDVEIAAAEELEGSPTTPSDVVEDTVAQLPVDIYQTKNLIVLFAQVAGASLGDISISLEGEGKIILIEGTRKLPVDSFVEAMPPGKFVAREGAWDNFYRRILLPVAIDIDAAEAKVSNGVLILSLPYISASNSKVANES